MRGEAKEGRRRRSWRAACVAAGVACASSLPVPAAAAVRRDALDESEVAAMRATHPHAVDLLERGEARVAEGRLAEADALFAAALVEHRSGSLLQRRRCEVLTALGRRAEATTACYRALEGARSNANVRASVRALVSGPVPPTITEAGLALDLAIKARDRAPGQLTPIAALCDIAASLGDGIMLERCAEDLHRIAPEAPDTRRAEALLATRRSPARGWAALGALAAGLVATLAHACLARARRSRKLTRGAAPAVGLLLAVALSWPSMASADVPGQQPGMLSKWPIDDAHPEASLPSETERNKDPLEFGYWLQDVILRAEVYSRHGKHDVAVKLYTALAMAVPERAIAFTKMCEEYEALGDREKAIAACETALLREGLMVKDYERYVRLVVATPGPLTERRTTALAQVIAHMREDPAGRAAADALGCDVGVRTSNVAELEACTVRLAASAPRDPETVSYRWALAMLKGDRDVARDLLTEARAAGLSDERIAGMERAMAGQASGIRARRLVLGAAVACFLGALGLVLLRSMRRRASPQVA